MSTCTQKRFSGELYELTEEAAKELVSSKYYNEDLAPISKSERTWTTYNIGMLWVGMVICITGFSFAAALVVLGMSPLLAIFNVLIGNLIVLVPMLLNSHAGTKYGIPFPVYARVSFGLKGAQVLSVARAIVAAGWCAVQCWVGGMAVSSIIGVFSSSWDVGGTGRFIGFGVFLLITLLVGLKGAEGIKWLENIGSPLLICVIIALLIWTIKLGGTVDYTFGDMFSTGSDTALANKHGGLVHMFMAGITSNIAVWATLALNIPDFSRYARSQKDQALGQIIAMPTSVMALAIIGAFFAEVTKRVYDEAIFDPTMILLHIDNKGVIIIVGIATIIATLTTNMAANVVAPANGFSNLSPKRISFRMGLVFTILLCIVYRPWWMYGDAGAFMFDWLGTVGTLLAPVAAILVADYFFTKRRRIDVASLFKEEGSRYEYFKGFNIRAFIAWICAAFVPMLGTFGVEGEAIKWISANSYIFGFAVGFVIYILIMKNDHVSPISEEEFESITEKADDDVLAKA